MVDRINLFMRHGVGSYVAMLDDASITGLASIHRINRVFKGVSPRKVPSELGRWELLKLPGPGRRGHLANAIVA